MKRLAGALLVLAVALVLLPAATASHTPAPDKKIAVLGPTLMVWTRPLLNGVTRVRQDESCK